MGGHAGVFDVRSAKSFQSVLTLVFSAGYSLTIGPQGAGQTTSKEATMDPAAAAAIALVILGVGAYIAQ